MTESFENEHFHLQQEIARSAFADMLHDHERNIKYFEALKKAIDKMHARNCRANVLDIGTGTGILSMMAVRYGADSVTAIEAFRPMADCAAQIIEANGMPDKIKIIKKRSTELREEDLPQRANILVTEVFDTELIGEGAIEIFNHAHKHLLESDCIVVPESATIYVQVVESPLAWSWNMPKLVANLDGDVLLRTPTEITDCEGIAELHDIQLNQFPVNGFREIVKPTAVFEFNWSGTSSSISKIESSVISVEAQVSGTVQAFFMWWILKMDEDNKIRISCAPHWAHEDYEQLRKDNPKYKPIRNVIPWRDHWMQAVFYPSKAIHVDSGQIFQLFCNRDEFSLWFDAKPIGVGKGLAINRPACSCGFHLSFSRNRIGQLNDTLRTKKFLQIFERTVDHDSTVLFLSDGSLIGLMIAAMKVKHVYYLDSNKYMRNIIIKYLEMNKISNFTVLEGVDDATIQWNAITHVIGEPYFATSILPWDNFYFADLLNKFRSKCDENVKILPKSAVIRAVPVEFLDLHKIFTPFGICESFDLRIFDSVIEQSSTFADDIVEAQPLWEYPSRTLGPIETVYSVNFTNEATAVETKTELTIEETGTCNGVALWIDYNFIDKPFDSNIELDDCIQWDMFVRQGVHLFWKPIHLTAPNQIVHIPCKVENIDGEICFNFTSKIKFSK